MPSPRVSVVIPTYNRADVLCRAIDSVLEQTITDIEVLVVDDGSTDETVQIVNSYTDDRIQLFSFDNNKGANVARIKGIKMANGDYLAFLDSDDEWLPKKVEAQLKAIQASNANVAYTGIKQVDADGSVNSISVPEKSGNITSKLLQENFIGSYSCILVETAAVDKVGYPDPRLPCWQDWEWYLRLSKQFEFIAVDRPLVVRHNEGGQISNNFQHRLAAFGILREKLQRYTSSSTQLRRSTAYLQFRIGYSALSNNKYSIARSRFAKAILLYPVETQFYKYLIASSPVYPIMRESKRIYVRLKHRLQ